MSPSDAFPAATLRASGPRIGYVLKMYPRFSETFVLTELLAREAQGEDIEVFSLRAPADGRFHEALAAVRAPVTYLRHGRLRGSEVWDLLRAAGARLPGLSEALPDLLGAEVDDAAQAVELALLVQERGIDHLHAHFGSVATTVARLAAALSGRTYSFTAHAKDIFHESVDPDDLRAKLRDAHHVVTVSDYNLTHLRRRFGADAARVHRVYNGLALDRVRDVSGPASAAGRSGSPGPQVAAVGRLVEKKGFDVLVDAIAVLARDGLYLPCVIAGTGPLEDALRGQIEQLGLAELVTLAGPLPQSRVCELVSTSAVFAAPCVVAPDGNADGLPTVLLEAMALGTACISTRVTGIPEAVRHEETGLLVEPGDPVGLAAALSRLVQDVALRARLAQAATRHVETHFDSARQARQLRGLLPAAAPAPAVAPAAVLPGRLVVA